MIASTIVVPVFGQASLTRQCLDLLLAPDAGLEETEIVVVDDGSRDTTAQVLASYGDRIRVVRHPANEGFAAACNDGAAIAEGEFLVFLNNDTLPRTGWLDALVRHARTRPRAAAVGARLLFPDETIQHAGIVFGPDRLPHGIYVGLPAEHPAVLRSRRYQAVTGACLLVRRRAFEAIGGFDLGYRNVYEDVDLCLRLGERGDEVHYCHESVLVHLFAHSRDPRHLPGGALRDIEAGRDRFLGRWSSRIEVDESRYYEEDGLLVFGSEALYPRTLSLSPILASRVGDPEPAAVDRILAERARRTFLLTREKTLLEGQVRALVEQVSLLAERLADVRRSDVRRSLAEQYLEGAGLEIGALHAPLPIGARTVVRYVDRMRAAELRRHYPELDGATLVEPDVVDDGERLASIVDASQDFVIANHFLEHCQDPIGALRNLLRVVKPSGIVYLAIPDKRFTFDRKRPVTCFDHLVRDHEEGPTGSRSAHFEEWVALGEDENRCGRDAAVLMAMEYSIHFHVWELDDMVEMLTASKRRFGLPFEIEAMMRHGMEVIFILRRSAAG